MDIRSKRWIEKKSWRAIEQFPLELSWKEDERHAGIFDANYLIEHRAFLRVDSNLLITNWKKRSKANGSFSAHMGIAAETRGDEEHEDEEEKEGGGAVEVGPVRAGRTK